MSALVARTCPALVVALAVLGCSKKPSDLLPEGASCNARDECASRHCVNARCSLGLEGAACSVGVVETGCSVGFDCVAGTCTTPARAEAARKQADAVKERALLEQSGVDVAAPVAEHPPAPAAASGARVRVVTTKSKGSAFASCRSDERLTGGSCAGWNLDQNGPTGFGSNDTVGARWSCHAAGADVEITAVALCATTRSIP